MHQAYSENNQYYQPSYQATSSGQWAGHGYQGMQSNETFNYGSSNYTTPNTCSTPCMGRCNPPKLYADTYSYLTENLMRPVIEEVYQDLASITASNTVSNNAAASKLGLAQPTQGQEFEQKHNGPTQVLDNVVPMASGDSQRQSQNVSGGQMRTAGQGFVQPNAAIPRNGLMQV